MPAVTMPPKPTTAKRIESLREEPEVRRWIKDTAVRSTAETQLVGLEIFLRRTGFTPSTLLALAKKDPDGLQDRVVDFLDRELKAGYSQKYSLNLWYAARAFLKKNNAAPAWNPKPKRLDDEEEGGDREVIPTFDQMRQIVNVLPIRARAAALLMSSSGIRVGVLAAQFEADGLRLRHLPELELDGPDAPKFHRSTAFLIRVPKHLSKTGKEYATFGNADAEDALLSYLRSRINGGEKLTPASPVIAADPRGNASGRKAKDGIVFVSRKSLAYTIADPMRRVAPTGVYWHTHLLRKWFSVQMEGCESRGLITKTRREFMMGHTSVDTRYNLETSEGVQKLRESYEACVPFLSLSETERKSIDVKAALLANLADRIEKATGKRPDSNLKGDDLANAIRDLLGASEAAPAGPPATPTPPPEIPVGKPGQQLVVDADAVGGFLGAGWMFKSPLNGSKAVVEWVGRSG
jgi:hypothetical protein